MLRPPQPPPIGDLVAVVFGGAALLVVAGARPAAVGGASAALQMVALVSVPLVIADVRQRLLPNVLTTPILLAVIAEAAGGLVVGRPGWPVLASLATLLALGALHSAGGLGMGDVKLGAALASPLATAAPELAVAGAVLAFLLAGLWALPPLLSGDRSRIPFGPFQLAAFWLVLALR